MAENLDFNPFFLFKTSFTQTIMGSFLNLPSFPKSVTEFISLPDEDKLALEVSTPSNWKEDGLTVVMVHGLCGSHKSKTLIRMVKRLNKLNIRAIRVNLRGCGSGKGHAKSTYHCGKSEDIEEVLKNLKQQTPKSPIILVGFSLGGNMVLKLAGDLKEKAENYLLKVIALSPPVDLISSVKLFENPENKIYLKYFTKLLQEDISYRKKQFPDFPDIRLPKDMTMTEFNEMFIVPFFGFNSLEDYYLKCSAKYVIQDIKLPCKVLLSKDDPLISHNSFDDVLLPDNVKVYLTEAGGHLGYLGNFRDKRGFYWLDSLLLDWILDKNFE